MSEAKIRLINGHLVDVLDLQREQVTIDAIAHALGQLNRFGGHCPWPYSVATHSVLVSYICELGDPAAAYEGLMHDATEALGCVDMPSPVKAHLPEYRKMEADVRRRIAPWFGLEPVEPTWVKEADMLALRLEQAMLQGLPFPAQLPETVWRLAMTFLDKPFTSTQATSMFLTRYAKIAKVLH
jgi:hypothetical protein